MTLMINPKYEYLREYISRLPETFEQEGRVIYRGRNLIKVLKIGDLEINVKRYGVPLLVNKIVYAFFRLSKGKRAFHYPEMLLAKGFETPCPIAYLEQKRWGLIQHSFFVSIQSPYQHKFYEFGNADVESCRDVVVAFAKYTARLHEAGILHRDYSPGNILFDEIDGEYHFSLVDINRMYFGPVSIERGCANFARLWGQKALFELLAREYASARGADAEYCRRQILFHRKKFWRKFKLKHPIKYKLEL